MPYRISRGHVKEEKEEDGRGEGKTSPG